MFLGQAWRAVVDLCYPGRCSICEADADGEVPLCPACLGGLERLASQAACPRCAMPVSEPGAPCPYCLGKGPSPFDRILRLGVYHDPLKELIHQLKYRQRWPLAEWLAECLYERPDVKELLGESDALVPVPLHPWRQIVRGYNQAHVIARRLSKLSGRPVIHPAMRLRHTPTQIQFHSRAEREANLKGAFGLRRPRRVTGQRIVVVDDVLTFGATLRALGRALGPAKPARLSAVVLAVADPRQGDFTTIASPRT